MMTRNAHCGYCGHRFSAEQAWPRLCAGCQQISYLNPIPVAVALVPVDGGLLCIRRGIEPHRGLLALPGGYVDFGETWQQACAREVREETGLFIAADEIRERRVLSAPRGLLLIFGEAHPRRAADLPPFVPTDETTERLIIDRPIELAFPLHTQVMHEWWQSGAAPT